MQPPSELVAVHHRKADVEQRDLGRECSSHRERRRAVVRDRDLVADPLEHLAQQLGGVTLSSTTSTRFDGPLGAGGARRRRRPALPASRREPDLELAAFPWSRASRHGRSAVKFHEALHEREPKPKAPLFPVGAALALDEEIEDSGAISGAIPVPLSFTVTTTLARRAGRGPRRARRVGVPRRVRQQIGDDLRESHGVAVDASPCAGTSMESR